MKKLLVTKGVHATLLKLLIRTNDLRVILDSFYLNLGFSHKKLFGYGSCCPGITEAEQNVSVVASYVLCRQGARGRQCKVDAITAG